MNKIINPSDDDAKQNATKQAHGFFYVDQILQVKTDGYNVQVTIGWKNPSGGYSPVATAAMPAPFAKELGDVLLKAAKDAAAVRSST